MEKLVTQSNIGIDKKRSQLYSAARKPIPNVSKQIRALFRTLMEYCDRQQENRLGWTAYTMAGQLYLSVPITLFAVVYNGNLFALWIPMIISSFCVLLCNLLALPTKITLPVFFTSIFISVVDITLSFIL
jgi:hypothetical protein